MKLTMTILLLAVAISAYGATFDYDLVSGVTLGRYIADVDFGNQFIAESASIDFEGVFTEGRATRYSLSGIPVTYSVAGFLVIDIMDGVSYEHATLTANHIYQIINPAIVQDGTFRLDIRTDYRLGPGDVINIKPTIAVDKFRLAIEAPEPSSYVSLLMLLGCSYAQIRKKMAQ